MRLGELIPAPYRMLASAVLLATLVGGWSIAALEGKVVMRKWGRSSGEGVTPRRIQCSIMVTTAD